MGKQTLAVRFGKRFARIEIAVLVFIPFMLNMLWAQEGFLFAAFLPWMTVLLAWKLVKAVWMTEPGKVYNVYLGFAALLHLAFSGLLCIGFSIR